MSDVFISYARGNKDVARRIATAVVAEGYGVWWDDDIPPHVSYSELIADKIATAKAAIVIWSREAAASEWVRAEADIARGARKLIQTSVDGTTPPLPFNLIQFAAIGDWNGEADHPGWKRVRASLAALCGAPTGTELPTAPPMSPEPVTEPPPVSAPPPPPPPPPPQPAPAAPGALQAATVPSDGHTGKRTLVWLGGVGALVLAVAGGAYLGSRAAGPQPTAPEPMPPVPPITAVPQTQPEPAPAPVPPPAPVETAAPAPVPASQFVQSATIEDPDGYTNVRAGPSTAFAVVGRVNQGEVIGTYPQTSEWHQVRLANGRVGYVAASRLRPVAAGTAGSHGQPDTAPSAPTVPVLRMDGAWTVTWSAVGTAYAGRMDVRGRSAVLNVSFLGMSVRQDCGVTTRGNIVSIRCRNVRFTRGTGNYSPDSFELTLRDSRTIQGRVRDTVGTTAAATFTRR